MTVNTRVIKLLLRKDDLTYVPLADGLRLQILPNTSFLPQCQKHHFAAFIQDAAILVVWDDDPNHLLDRAQSIEDQLMHMIWRDQNEEELDEKTSAPKSKMTSRAPSIYIQETDSSDLEDVFEETPRRVVLIQPVLTAMTIALCVAAIAAGWRKIAIELAFDSKYIRIAFIAAVPIQMWLALVCDISHSSGILANITSVFLSVHYQLPRSTFWSYQPDEPEFEILLGTAPSPTSSQRFTPRHDPVPSIQRRVVVRHSSYCPVRQSGNFNIRNARGHCQYIHQ